MPEIGLRGFRFPTYDEILVAIVVYANMLKILHEAK